jgi:hypothetical protein
LLSRAPVRNPGFAILLAGAAACAAPPDFGDGGEPLDPARIDRSAPGGACGHPGPGDVGYGTAVGERLANNGSLALVDCLGEPIELSDFFCERDDEYGDFNRGVLVNIGAGWCAPCQEETLEFPDLYAEYHARGIEFVQVLFQDWHAQAPTASFCTDWRSGEWTDGESESHALDLAFPIVLDQRFEWTSVYLQDPAAATPLNMLIDANGNIRWKLEGQKPDGDALRTQFELVIAEPYAPPT